MTRLSSIFVLTTAIAISSFSVSASEKEITSCESIEVPALSQFESIAAFTTEVRRLSKVCDDEASALLEDAKTARASGLISYTEYIHIRDKVYLPLMTKASQILLKASQELIKPSDDILATQATLAPLQ